MLMGMDSSSGDDAPAGEPAAPTPPVRTQVDIDSERRRIEADRTARRVRLGASPTPETLADIESHIRLMEGEHLAVAYEICGPFAGDDPDAIAELQNRLGHGGPARSYTLRQVLNALCLGVLPVAPSAVTRVHRKIRVFHRRFEGSLRLDSKDFLRENEQMLDRMLNDESAQEAEEEEAAQAEASYAKKLAKAGVYVFTYPHYYRYPTVPSGYNDRLHDRTLMKIGRADNLGRRIDEVANVTAAPEPRRILRLYLPRSDSDPVDAIERKFHGMLDDAGHAGPRRASRERQTGGTEWFATSLEFLDSIADLLRLEIVELDAVEGL